MVEIVEVEVKASQHLLHGVGISVVDGSPRGQPRPHEVDVLIVRVVGHDLADVTFALRTRPHERHVTHEDVPQLWQLVQVMVAQCGGQW